MNRRNFFKGLCALAVAPLAAALPTLSKPKAESTIRKIEASLTGNQAKPYDSRDICVFRVDYLDKEGNIIPHEIVEAACLDLAERAEFTRRMMYQNFEDLRP